MKNRLILIVVAAGLMFGSGRVGCADMTPLDEKIPEKKPTNITCELPATLVTLSGMKLKLTPDEYHYQVLLPSGYYASGKREYPCLFVAMPGGDATPGSFTERLEQDQWMAVCLTESKNGSGESNLGNFLAAHDDAVKRFRVADHFKFMTGFSGGARTASICTSLRSGFAGLFVQGAGFAGPMNMYNMETLRTNPGLSVYGLFGITDDNREEAPMLNAQLTQVNPRRFSMAEGGHQAASKESAEEGMDYLEDILYVRRPTPDKAAQDQYVIRFQLLMEQAKGEEGFAKYEVFEKADRMAIARKLGMDKTLAADVTELAKQVKALAALPEVAKELAARAAYFKIRDLEDANWPPLALQGPKLSDFAKQAGAAYDAMGKKFEGTVYGTKAAERGAWLDKGVEKPAKAAAKEKD